MCVFVYGRKKKLTLSLSVLPIQCQQLHNLPYAKLKLRPFVYKEISKQDFFLSFRISFSLSLDLLCRVFCCCCLLVFAI